MVNQGIQSYRKVNVTTSNPVQLILMCYEGAIDNLKIAKQKYIAKDYEAKSRAIQKFMDIIAELQCALDFEKGAEVAKNLDAVYNYVTRKILEADLQHDLDAFDSVIDMLKDLMPAWEGLLKQQDNATQPMGGYNQCGPLKRQGYIAA